MSFFSNTTTFQLRNYYSLNETTFAITDLDMYEQKTSILMSCLIGHPKFIIGDNIERSDHSWWLFKIDSGYVYCECQSDLFSDCFGEYKVWVEYVLGKSQKFDTIESLLRHDIPLACHTVHFKNKIFEYNFKNTMTVKPEDDQTSQLDNYLKESYGFSSKDMFDYLTLCEIEEIISSSPELKYRVYIRSNLRYKNMINQEYEEDNKNKNSYN